MKILKHKKIILFFLALTLIVFGSEVFALEVLGNIPSPTGRRLTDESSITEVVAFFYEWGIALGGLAAFIALIIAGFQYLTSMGEPAKMKEAKDRISSAFLGLILLLSSWLILNTINPQLTSLTPPSFTPPSGEPTSSLDAVKNKIPNCKRVTLYSDENFGGRVVGNITKDFEDAHSLSGTPLSIEIVEENGCQVSFYKDHKCDSENFISPTILKSYKNLRLLFGDEINNIRCVKVTRLNMDEVFPEESPYEFHR
jgi:hypothetical protein